MSQLKKVVHAALSVQFGSLWETECFFFHSLILTTSHLPKNYQFQPHPHVCWNKYWWSSHFFDFGFTAHNIGSGQYGYSWMCTSVHSRQEAELVGSNPRDELKRYLDSPLEEVNDVVAWWGVSRFGFHPWRYILTGLNYIASLIPIPYPFEHGLWISCYPMVCYTFRVSIFKWRNHQNCQMQLQLLKSAYLNCWMDKILAFIGIVPRLQDEWDANDSFYGSFLDVVPFCSLLSFQLATHTWLRTYYSRYRMAFVSYRMVLISYFFLVIYICIVSK